MDQEDSRLKVVPIGDVRAPSIWEALETTDPRFTKRMDTGAKLTSINAEYQFKKMSEFFGPIGHGWGFEVMSSEIVNCGPCWRLVGDQLVKDGKVQVHTCRVILWYVHPGDLEKDPIPFHRVHGVGHTPFRVQSTMKDGTPNGARVDMEYEKKSVTDAVTKAMSYLGMTADVRMGMFDMPDYVAGVKDDFAIAEAESKTEEVIRQRHEFQDWLTSFRQLIDGAMHVRELELLWKPALPRIQRQGTKEEVEMATGWKNDNFRRLTEKARASTGGAA